MIDAENIRVIRAGSPILAFGDVHIRKAERVMLAGPSGSGKSTLLSVLAGLLKPQEGKVRFEGQDIHALPEERADRLRGRYFGFVFQSLHLLPALTLRENVALAGGLFGNTDDRRVDKLLRKLDLTEKSHRRPAALSQGEQQRAAIARAVFNRPSIIIADEPTSSLDDENAMTVMNLLEEQAAENNSALLVATHDNRIRDRFQKIISLNAEKKQ